MKENIQETFLSFYKGREQKKENNINELISKLSRKFLDRKSARRMEIQIEKFAGDNRRKNLGISFDFHSGFFYVSKSRDEYFLSCGKDQKKDFQLKV